MTMSQDGVALSSMSHPVPDDVDPASVETIEIELSPSRARPTNGTRPLNDTGLGFFGIGNEKMRDIRVYEESGVVQVWCEINDHGSVREAVQYLNPIEAMAFAKAFKRCALAALKKIA